MPIPPALAAGTYRFPNSHGYYGQAYRYIAHDPFFRKGYAAFVDDPRLRYRRILVPVLAFLLAGGQQQLIDGAYIAAMLLWLCAGVYWTARCAALYGRSPVWGLLFVLVPGCLTSIDRELLEGPFCALFAAFVLYSTTNRRWALWFVLASAALTRETGLLLIAATCLFWLARRRFASVAFYGSAAVPFLLWTLFVTAHTPPSHADAIFSRPVYGVVMQLFTPQSYPYPPLIGGVMQALDVLAVAGHLLAFALALWWVARAKQRGAAEIAAVLFTILGLMLGARDQMIDAYGFARPISPLYLYLFLRFLSERIGCMIAPMLMVSGKILLFFASQFLGIVGIHPVHGAFTDGGVVQRGPGFSARNLGGSGSARLVGRG